MKHILKKQEQKIWLFWWLDGTYECTRTIGTVFEHDNFSCVKLHCKKIQMTWQIKGQTTKDQGRTHRMVECGYSHTRLLPNFFFHILDLNNELYTIYVVFLFMFLTQHSGRKCIDYQRILQGIELVIGKKNTSKPYLLAIVFNVLQVCFVNIYSLFGILVTPILKA